MHHWTLALIRNALKELAAKGWIKSNRKHDTGIGKTLEDHLGITENNIALPDFGIMELKTQRINTSSMMTLFTKSPAGMANAQIRERFGYPDQEFPAVKILHQTIESGRANAMGFHCDIDASQQKLLVLKGREVIGFYDLDFIKQQATKKVGSGLILVLAETKREKRGEYFHFKEAYILKEIDPEQLLAHSKYDIRLGVYHSGKKAGQRHDHGSAFRIPKKSVPLLFKIRERIL